MQILPAPPQPGAILSFDFDGTMHHPADDPPVPLELFEEIRRIRCDYGAVWGINTGRSLEHVMEGLVESGFPFLPDWVVARECEIHTPRTRVQWTSHSTWNERMHRETKDLFLKARHVLDRIRHEIEEHTGAHWMDAEGEPAGLISRTLEEMEWIMTRVIDLAGDHPHLAWQRNSIYLRFCHRDYHKGSCLSEVARMHQVPAGRCFAIGDSHNDFEMLHPDHAGMIACPVNAVPEIAQAVSSVGGLVTSAAHGSGAVEALRHFFPPRGELHAGA
jgi:hydroxymethylpyrimidine pyrophosphatase-like HAD family hydrolase